jgi:bleomycin hydrolase
MDITSQHKSGRCWIFAGMNVMRYALRKKCGLRDKNFELSQSYMMFWDKLEKGNYFLESVIDTAGEDKSSRLVMWLFANLLGDGGQWDMLVSLIDKYGVVPKYAMPESYHSGNSARMNSILKRKLRRDGVILRGMHAQGRSDAELRAEKEKMTGELYTMLCAFLGEPPEKFEFAYRSADGAYHRDSGLTPKEFYQKYWGADFLSRFVSVINAPTDDKPFGRTYTVKYLGSVVDGRPVTYLNLPAGRLEQAACAQIADGEPVWFGSDVGKFSERDKGMLDTELFDYEGALGVKLDMSESRYARLRRKLPYARHDARGLRFGRRSGPPLEGGEQLGRRRGREGLFRHERRMVQGLCLPGRRG